LRRLVNLIGQVGIIWVYFPHVTLLCLVICAKFLPIKVHYYLCKVFTHKSSLLLGLLRTKKGVGDMYFTLFYPWVIWVKLVLLVICAKFLPIKFEFTSNYIMFG
jgi:hypothetical protein